MKKITVLGAGQVGRAIAIDLCKDYEVSSADVSPDNLKLLSASFPIRTTIADLSDGEVIRKMIADADLVVGAVPGFMGFNMVKTVLSAGKNIVDISFFNEDIFLLDELAKKHNAVAIMDCGVAPGLDNIILGYHNRTMEIDFFECLVGGLPVVRTFPYQYKAPFSPIDVIAEYTRPARFVQDGKLVVKEALTDPEYLEFQQVGTLEAFNTDGLRSLIKTMKIPNMIERTLRYPGHIDLMKVLRDTGYFDDTPIQIGNASVRPIDLTSRLLFPKWKLAEGEEEYTIMRVTIRGKENGKETRYVYDLLDRYDKNTRTTSMARTTGYTCTAAARLVIENRYVQKGISPPEYIGAYESCFSKIISDLKERNIHLTVSKTTA